MVPLNTAAAGGAEAQTAGAPGAEREDMEHDLFTQDTDRSFAVISDIHSNLPALRAVVEDIERQKADGIICLGDIVGYGPEPEACTRIIRETAKLCVMGNHDYIMLYYPAGITRVAKEAAIWTKKKMTPRFYNFFLKTANWRFLKSLPRETECGEWLFVHGSPRDPLSEYVHMENQDFRENTGLLKDLFSGFSRICMVGHTHIPGALDSDFTFFRPDESSPVFQPAERKKALINVGSVGQPRDGDPRACYVLASQNRFEFRRVTYDIESTAEKIRKTPALDNRLADRLYAGK